MKIFLTIFIIFILTYCSKTETDEIVAVVGNKSVSLNEFIRRAEYTIRPAYCKGNTPLHKKIILNSLIAEKLFALEFEKKIGELRNPSVLRFLQGRKEQAMRQILYYEEVSKKIQPDSILIEQFLKFANRKYNIKYINIKDTIILNQLREELNSKNFESFLRSNYGLTDIPERTVEWNYLENYKILQKIYTKNLNKGDLLEPIYLPESKSYLIIKIDGFTFNPLITEQQQNDVKRKVEERVNEELEASYFEYYIKQIMKGKRVEFEKEVFFRFTDAVAPLYIISKEDKEKVLFNQENQESLFAENNKAFIALEDLKNQIILSYNNEKWTVEKLIDEIKLHPLVFRKKNISNPEFGFELQMAILDLLRDKELTKIAFQRGYNNDKMVDRNLKTWEDNLKYLYMKKNIVSELNKNNFNNLDDIEIIQKYFNPIVDSLMNQYSKSIKINSEILNTIKLSTIDLVATFSGMPYKKVVPEFPVVTDKKTFNFGSIIKNSNK